MSMLHILYRWKNDKNFVVFLLMFFVNLILHIDYTILRSIRSTLAVTDLCHSAYNIPIFELFGTMPSAFAVTALLSILLNRFSMKKVFVITLAFFLSFFLLFSNLIYPFLKTLSPSGQSTFITLTCTMFFYAIAELWKPALIMILFWGLVNQSTPVNVGKKLYAPLALGSSIASIIAGPIIRFSTNWAQKWNGALDALILVLVFLSCIACGLYLKLYALLSKRETLEDRPKFSFKENILACIQSPHLKLLSWIVIADYIAYSLGEIIFLDILKKYYPNPKEYCQYMGLLASWTGALTLFASLVITPYILSKYRWTVAALVLPITLLITESSFFLVLRDSTFTIAWMTKEQWLSLAITLGSIQYCVCRSAKYTLFDSAKELAFVLIPHRPQIQGKLIVDGLCSRFGRGGGAVLSIALIQLCGGVAASAPLTGIVSIGITLSLIMKTAKLGKLIGISSSDQEGKTKPFMNKLTKV